MHAKEPWTAIHLDDQWCEIYCIGYKLDGRFRIADGERIAACINACRGVPTEVLIGATKEGGLDCRCGLQAVASHSGYLVSGPHDD